MDRRGASRRAPLRAAHATGAASPSPEVRGRGRAGLPVPALRGRGGPRLASLRWPGAVQATQLHDGRRAQARPLGHAQVRGRLADGRDLRVAHRRRAGRARRRGRPGRDSGASAGPTCDGR